MKISDQFSQPHSNNVFNYAIPSPIYANNTAPVSNVPLIPQPLATHKRLPSPIVQPVTKIKKDNRIYDVQVQHDKNKNKNINTVYVSPIYLPEIQDIPADITFTSPLSPKQSNVSEQHNTYNVHTTHQNHLSQANTHTTHQNHLSQANTHVTQQNSPTVIPTQYDTVKLVTPFTQIPFVPVQNMSPVNSFVSSPTSFNYQDLIPKPFTNKNYNPFLQNDLINYNVESKYQNKNVPQIPINNAKTYDLTTPQNATATVDVPMYFNQVQIKTVTPIQSPKKSPYILSPQNIMNKFKDGLSLSNDEKKILIEEIKRQPTKTPSPVLSKDITNNTPRITDYHKLKIANYQNLTELEKEYYRNDFIDKFEKLKKPPYNFTIKNIDYQNTSLEVMHIVYNSYERTINKNYEIDQYFMILVVLWAGIEAISHIFKFPIKGYTKFQVKRYQTYRSLLNGLGDTYTEDGEIVIKPSWVENYSPFAKICILSVGNIIFFVIYRFLSKGMGEAHADSVVDMLASKLYGEGDQKEVNQIINEMTGNKENNSSFNFGNLIGNLVSGNGLSNLGTILSSFMGNNKEETKVANPVEVEIDMDSPIIKKPTYDDSVPNVLSPANMGFDCT